MGSYSDNNSQHVKLLSQHLDLSPPDNDPVRAYSGPVDVTEGTLDLTNITVIHNRSISEDVKVLRGGALYTGTVVIENGALNDPNLSLSGYSLLHSVPLTAQAFRSSFLGQWESIW